MSTKMTKPRLKKSAVARPAEGSQSRIMSAADAATNPRAVAQSLLSPGVNAANTVQRWVHSWENGEGGEVKDDPQQRGVEVLALAQELFENSRAVLSGDMNRSEVMLSSQAHTLDAIFNSLAQRAARNIGAGYRDAAEAYLRLALRAQSQCRATLETLAFIKNPPSIAFVRQANVANGPQQVNNGAVVRADGSRAHASESDSAPNKLLEQLHGERLDPGTAQAAVGADTTVEAVAKVDRPANGEG